MDLPAWLRPTSATVSPAATSKLTSSTTFPAEGNERRTERARIAGKPAYSRKAVPAGTGQAIATPSGAV